MNDAEGIEPGVTAAVQKAIELARELGAEVGECELPRSVEYGLACYYLIAPAEASSNLARYDGVRYALRVEADSYDAMVERTRDAGFGDEPKRRIMLGAYALSAGYYEAYYGQAQKVRTVIVREHAAAFERFDVLVSPTSPTVAFELGAKTADPLAMYLSDLLDDPVLHGGAAGPEHPVRPLRRPPGRAAADRAAALREHALPRRPRAGDGARLRPRSGAAPMSWEPVVGLEVHVQLKTRTKMFCRCANGFGGGENTQTCPVCLGFPGALPVANRIALEWTVKLGLALGCEIAERAVFARKHYPYPDLPKGYQISQYDLPSCIDGKVLVPTAEGDHEVEIVRAHLEEDAAKNTHVGGRTGRIGGADYSLVDFNRGGTPLVEIVTGRTSTPPRTRAAFSSCCARRSSSSGSRTRRWRRASCGSTPTSPSVRPARPSCARAAS